MQQDERDFIATVGVVIAVIGVVFAIWMSSAPDAAKYFAITSLILMIISLYILMIMKKVKRLEELCHQEKNQEKKEE